MNLIVAKSISIIVLGSALVFYAATISGHLFMEYSFTQSTLHMHKSILNLTPGAYLAEDDMTTYCVDEAIAGRAVGPGRWSEKYCDTGPARRITVYSRYMRKYWVLYVNQDRQVTFKRAWVVL